MFDSNRKRFDSNRKKFDSKRKKFDSKIFCKIQIHVWMRIKLFKFDSKISYFKLKFESNFKMFESNFKMFESN